MKYEIVIPVEADSINGAFKYGAEETAIRSLKRKWEELAKAYLYQAIDTRELPARFRFKVRIGFSMFYRLKALRDEDNTFVIVKGIIDAIVKCGIVHDDNSEFVEFGGVRLLEDRDRPRVVLEIEELAPFAVSDEGATIKAYAPRTHHA